MAECKELSQRVLTAGLHRVGYQYQASFWEWLGMVFNPIHKKKVRFDVVTGTRFSFSTVDHPAPSLLGTYEKKRVILVDLKAGDILLLKVSGDFKPKRIEFIIDEPGSFKA